MEIVKAFLNDYEITNERKDFVLNNDLRKWLKKYDIPVPTLHKHIEKHCRTNGLKYEKARLRHKGTQGLGMCYVKSRIPEKEEIVSLNDEIAEDEERDHEDAMPLCDLDDDSLKPFDEWFISVKTHRMHHIDDYVPWIKSDDDEYLIIEQDGHKELVLKSVIKDLLI